MDVQLHAEGRRLLDERLAATQDKLEDIPLLSGGDKARVVGLSPTQTKPQPQLQQHHCAPPADLLHVSTAV